MGDATRALRHLAEHKESHAVKELAARVKLPLDRIEYPLFPGSGPTYLPNTNNTLAMMYGPSHTTDRGVLH